MKKIKSKYKRPGRPKSVRVRPNLTTIVISSACHARLKALRSSADSWDAFFIRVCERMERDRKPLDS